eukprot:TRINITY_DN3569_c1_g1_i1.p1 TRINITY_DN3569_c1_g1~~TRINITY_DN3569_c1_g1_i1.p1  ORF type:complete len:136 (+),score=41.13 TRINITY_DN3569_c1_g1_i1:68-475(+)
MVTALQRLDIAMEANPALQTPPRTPVRTYYDAAKNPPPLSPGQFIDWEPGMHGMDCPSLDATDFEEALRTSPLARRFQSPKGEMIGLVNEVSDAAIEDPNEEPEETDMRKLEEAYQQVLAMKQAREEKEDADEMS